EVYRRSARLRARNRLDRRRARLGHRLPRGGDHRLRSRARTAARRLAPRDRRDRDDPLAARDVRCRTRAARREASEAAARTPRAPAARPPPRGAAPAHAARRGSGQLRLVERWLALRRDEPDDRLAAALASPPAARACTATRTTRSSDRKRRPGGGTAPRS